MSKPKYQPSLYVAKLPEETARQFHERILRDHKLLPDQRLSLEQDANSFFSDCVQGIWIEQSPIVAGGA